MVYRKEPLVEGHALPMMGEQYARMEKWRRNVGGADENNSH